MSSSSTAVLSLLLLLIQVSSGLRCYHCATTSPNSKCVSDYQGFVNDSKGVTPYRYAQECSPGNDRCMIESLEQDGKLTSYLRGCHDGKTFGAQFENPRFHNLSPATNMTVCANVIVLACYTFCDTDLCNGPQWVPPKPDPCANVTYYDDYEDIPEGCNPWDLFNGSAQLDKMAASVLVTWCMLVFCLTECLRRPTL